MIDVHHILPKSKYKVNGKYPKWINCPINLIEIEHYMHINEVHAPSGNTKGEYARMRVYNQAVERLWAFADIGYWKLNKEQIKAIDCVYKWCLIDNGYKHAKPHDELEVFIEVCKEWESEL